MDDLMLMACEAHHKLVTEDYPGHTGQLDPWTIRLLERFAQLVAKKAVEAERERLKPVHEFLRGSSPLEGVWYGEKHPTAKGRYWWRTYLPLD